MQITTPSGAVVEFRDQLTFGDKKAVKRVIQNALKFDVESKESQDVGLGFMIDAQEVLISRVITEIREPNGKVITSSFVKYIDSLNVEDGQFIFDKIDEQFGSALLIGETPQKKTE